MTHTVHVLFVDDEPHILNAISRYFRGDSVIRPALVSSPVDAIRVLSQRSVDLIVSDWSMPDMDGGELLSLVARRFPSVKRALMTGIPDLTEVARAINESGITGLFLKPVDLRSMRGQLLRCSGAAAGINGHRRREEHLFLRRTVEGMLVMAAGIAPGMVQHARRVASLSSDLYELFLARPDRADYSVERLRRGQETLYFAGLLHDLGKLFVEQRMLSKDSLLYPEQIHRLRHRLAVLDAYLHGHHATPPHLQRALDHAIGVLSDPPRGAAPWRQFGDHLARISELTTDARRELELELVDEEMAEGLYGAAVGTLTPTERDAVEKHTHYSEHLAASIPWPADLQNVPLLCRHHHERLDGSGYPDGLRGAEEISDELSVLMVADIFDAMTDPVRTYREPLNTADALEILRRQANAGQLNPAVVDTLIALKELT